MRTRSKVRACLALALTGVLTVGLSVPPAGASNTTRLPKVDPHNYHATPIRIETIVPGRAADLGDPHSWTTMHYWFARNLKNSRWLKALGSSAEYGFSALTAPITDAIFDPPGVDHIISSTPTFDRLTNYIYRAASARHVPFRPNRRTVWTMFTYCEPDVMFGNAFPCGIDFNQPVTAAEVAQHPDLFHLGDAIAVATESTEKKHPCIGVAACSVTGGLSHEIGEAITGWGVANGQAVSGYVIHADPDSPWIDPGTGFDDNSPWAWNINEGGGAQLVDMAGFDTRDTEVFDKASDAYGHHLHYTFTYQRIPHRIPAAVGDDPFLPSQPGRYYSTSTQQAWYDARHANGLLTISDRAVAEGPVAPWTVQAVDAAWDGQGKFGSSSGTGPCFPTITGPLPSPHGVYVERGEQYALSVSFNPASTARWCVIRIKSHRYGDESSTSHADAGDFFHDDLVGFILPAALNP